MPHITQQDILNMDQRYRVNFINSLSGFKSFNLVGTINKHGQTNLAPFSSVIHLGASPALIGMISRPASTSGRHTLDNILETGWYTLNHVDPSFIEQAHQCSARYTREESEFDATGLKERYIDPCPAPAVAQSALSILVQFREQLPIELNGTTLIIGEIMGVDMDHQDAILDSGFINLETLHSVTCSGLDAYHSTTLIKRLSYAKPDKLPTEIQD